MPSFADYKRMTLRGGTTTGQHRTYDSQSIIEATWYDDPSATVAYVYDFYHDDEPDLCVGMNPEKSKTKIPVDIKYIINSYQSLSQDTVDYRIMFKPSYECNVPYYKEVFEKTCHCEYPLGMYFDIKDEKGIWHKWLVVAAANRYNNDFPNWSILPCTYRYSWVHEGKKYRMWGAPRSQSSYNFGEWQEYKLSFQENQTKFVVPYNKITATLFHNMRMVYSPQIEVPICWRVTKVEGVNPFGLMNITLYQDMFNPHTDVIEYDNDGNWIAAWADLKKEGNVQQDKPVDPAIIEDYAVIEYSGTAPTLKVNGSYKKITIKYYNSGELLANQTPGEWSFWYKDKDDKYVNVDDLVKILETDQENSIKIKFLGDEEYLGTILIVRNTRGKVVADFSFEIVSL